MRKCHVCGAPYAPELGRYGCPNCFAEGLIYNATLRTRCGCWGQTGVQLPAGAEVAVEWYPMPGKYIIRGGPMNGAVIDATLLKFDDE